MRAGPSDVPGFSGHLPKRGCNPPSLCCDASRGLILRPEHGVVDVGTSLVRTLFGFVSQLAPYLIACLLAPNLPVDWTLFVVSQRVSPCYSCQVVSILCLVEHDLHTMHARTPFARPATLWTLHPIGMPASTRFYRNRDPSPAVSSVFTLSAMMQGG